MGMGEGIPHEQPGAACAPADREAELVSMRQRCAELSETNLKLQAQIRQGQKMECLGVLAGGVAHDMNNVLGAILGLASVYSETHSEDTTVGRAFNTIFKAATRGSVLVKSLLAFSRQTLPDEQELNLNAVIQDEARILERTTLSRVKLVLDLAPDLRTVYGDISALTHALMNLCVNAVDAMPEHGTLTLRTRNVDDNWVEVAVIDTGTGMPQDVMERALDPFFTTKEVGKGTGMGLPMVFTTVKSHRGHLDIQSEVDRGTCVRLRFPVCSAMMALVNPQVNTFRERRKGGPRPSYAPGSTLTVLVVDDDEFIRASIQTLLDHLGHTALLARSGEEALVKFQASFEPDVVVLDVNMPGLGGLKILPILRSLRPHLPVILATGQVDPVVSTLAETYPHVALLPKPFTISDLKRQLERLA